MCVLASVLFVGVGSAAASMGQFGEPGNEGGQFAEPRGIAIDQASGDIYISDRNNQRVERFNAAGGFLTAWGWGIADGTTKAFQTCTMTCFAGINGTGTGQFNFPEGVTVDNSTNPLDTSVGDVYVVDVRNRRVEKFSASGVFLLMFGGEVNETTKGDVCLAGEECKAGTPGTNNGQFTIGPATGTSSIAVDSNGIVYVGDENRVQEFTPDGAYLSQVTLGGAGFTTALVVNSVGDLYTRSRELSGVREYDQSGTLMATLDSEGSPKTLALDTSSDDVFIDDASVGPGHRILKYDASGKELASFDAGMEDGERGITFGETSGELYVVNKSVVRLVTPPPPGPLVEPGSELATEALRSSAIVNATVNPEGHEASSGEEMSYRFEYGETEAYGSTTPMKISTGGSFEDRSLSTALTALHPRTTYHFRVVATNAAHESTSGSDSTFTTLPPASIDGESVSNVASSSITLGAQIDPLGSDTKYHFEYDTNAYSGSASHGASVPVPDGDTGSGTSDVAVSEHVQGLTPGTTYHYRVVANNELGVVEGLDRSFTTQPVGASLALPDGRRWELVSPPDKHGATIQGFDATGTATQASEGGGAITYAASSPTEVAPPGNVGPERVQVLSARAAGSWKSGDIATPHNVPTAENQTGHESEYELFSGDLSLGLVEPVGETPLSLDASKRTPYRRDNASDTYEPLVTSANAPGAEFANQVKLVSATPDLSHIIVESGVSLTTPPMGAGLYEWVGGQLQPVSVLPNEKPAPEPLLGNHGYSAGGFVRHAISNDGSRIVWEAEGHLYLRDMNKKETVQLDVVESGARGGGGVPAFQTASSDGSKVFFTDTDRLTADSKKGGDLYEFEITGGGVVGTLRDLNTGGVSGVVLGASEDGSYIYVVNGSVLTEVENADNEKAVPGGNNLYVLHDNGAEWTTTFVALLSGDDQHDWEGLAGHLDYFAQLTSRVSPNGRWLTFMSDRSLTGYDNHDAASGEPDEEVFLYDANSGRVVCASCNPSGARPTGMFDRGKVPLPLVDPPEVWEGRWLAGLIPGWTPDRLNHAIYQSRYLSDGGRLFFDSPDALVPHDTNGTEDVYEYEPNGEGNCHREPGCVALISSGTSGEESAFLDASANGDDVFFLTAARLTPQDRDASLDVYDAHVCSTTAPCLSPSVASPPVCTNSDSCRAAPSPQPPIFGASASATFSGVGNIIPQLAKVEPKQVKCKRGLVRQKIRGKARCVKRKVRRARNVKRSTSGGKK